MNNIKIDNASILAKILRIWRVEPVDGDRLPDMSETKKGGVPATGTPSGKFLRDDGTWQSIP
jgi:hypothetical protein